MLTGKITLRDLKRCRMAHIFYDTFFNLEKYLDHEQRDPFAVQKVRLAVKSFIQVRWVIITFLCECHFNCVCTRFRIWTATVQSHQTGINMLLKSMRFLSRRKQPMSSCEMGEPRQSIMTSHRQPINALVERQRITLHACFRRSFDDDYESDELTISSDIGHKMDKLVISDLTA